MKIVFILGGLEPGANGVGDYSRLLAEEVVRRGQHQCALVALSDPFVSSPSKSNLSAGIRQLRLPANMDWKARMKLATAFVDEFSPDWVSLQFVPYSFQKRGIVRGLAARLKALTKNRRVQIMFHELWIGEDKGNSRKNRIVGAIQRRYVLGLIKALRPVTVNTSNTRYMGFLTREGVKAEMLPLFGNILLNTQPQNDWLYSLLQQQGVGISNANREQFWLIGFFGSLRSGWTSEPLFSQLRQAAATAGRRVVILAAGRLGNDGLWKNLEEQYCSDFTFLKLGEQAPERISEYLQALDAGIAVSPLSIIGKSGAAAAMLDHGIPVLINRLDIDPAPFINSPEQPLLQPVDPTFKDRLVQGLPRSKPHPVLPQVAETFLSAMSEAKPK